MNPELHHRLAAQRRAEHLATAERHRLVRRAAPPRAGRTRAGASALSARRALGARLVLIGWRLMDGVSEPV